MNLQLLNTARKNLLDENIGIRNAMPADFHELYNEYNYSREEVGQPYRYFNAGIWPQNIIWYIGRT